MRHAKSDWSANGDDHARPLNTRGQKSAQAALSAGDNKTCKDKADDKEMRRDGIQHPRQRPKSSVTAMEQSHAAQGQAYNSKGGTGARGAWPYGHGPVLNLITLRLHSS